MNPKFGRRQWVKLWVNEWLDGTTRFEMNDAQRAFWVDLLALAGRSRFPGRICAGSTPDGSYIGYPLNKFQALMAEPIDVWQTLELFERTGKVKITITTEEPIRLVMLELLNWNKFQSEYQRQKPYRERALQRSDTDSYTAGDTEGNTTEGEGEVRRKKETERTTQATGSAAGRRVREKKADEWNAEGAFAELWADLLAAKAPKPVHKDAALRAFRKRVVSEEVYRRFQGALASYRSSDRVRRGFVMDAATYINDWESWENYQEPPRREPTANEVLGLADSPLVTVAAAPTPDGMAEADAAFFADRKRGEEERRQKEKLERREQWDKAQEGFARWTGRFGAIPTGRFEQSRPRHVSFLQEVGLTADQWRALQKEFEGVTVGP